MDSNQNRCQKCGAPMAACTTFCTSCGAGNIQPQPQASSAVTPLASSSTSSQPAYGTVPSQPAAAPAAPSATAASTPPATPSSATATPGTSAGATPPPATYGAPSQPSAYGSASQPATPAASQGTASQPSAYGSASQPGAAPAASQGTASQPSAYGTAGQPSAYGTTSQQPAYGSAPSAGASPYGTTGQQPAAPGYGTTGQAQPSYPGAGGYTAPQSYGTPGQSGYGGGYGQPPYGQPPAPPPKKKKGPIVPIIIVLVAALVIGLVGYFVYANQQAKKIEAEYAAIVTSICESNSPRNVVRAASALDTFKTTHPTFEIDDDLETLIDACENYEEAGEDEDRYTDMIAELQTLKSSSSAQVADCSSTLLRKVEDEYEMYLDSLIVDDLPPIDEVVPEGGGGDTVEAPLAPLTYAKLDNSGGEETFYFSAENISDKTIVYFEVFTFFYDADGNPVEDSYGDNWEWDYSDYTLAPGDTFTPDMKIFYRRYLEGLGGAFGIPFFSYVEFSDGTTYGYTEDTMSATMQEYIDTMRVLVYDPWGVEAAQSNAYASFPYSPAGVATVYSLQPDCILNSKKILA